MSKQAPEFGGAKSDVGSTIVSILEVAESDFTTMLAEAEAAENEAQSAYDKLVQDNAVTKATKDSELDAVLEYLDKLKPQCAVKVVSYAEKKARREQEIAGLKEALEILAADASFLQTGLVRRA